MNYRNYDDLYIEHERSKCFWECLVCGGMIHQPYYLLGCSKEIELELEVLKEEVML
jgi:hypothetical protein